MKLIETTEKELAKIKRLINLIELELYGENWVLITAKGMITSPDLTPEKHKDFLSWAQQAIELSPTGMRIKDA